MLTTSLCLCVAARHAVNRYSTVLVVNHRETDSDSNSIFTFSKANMILLNNKNTGERKKVI